MPLTIVSGKKNRRECRQMPVITAFVCLCARLFPKRVTSLSSLPFINVLSLSPSGAREVTRLGAIAAAGVPLHPIARRPYATAVE
jgi:hypothetical protein